MKRKVFFVVSSFAAGGAERVFWILSQAFDKAEFDVTIVLMDTRNSAFSLKIPRVRVIDLGTIRAAQSFFPLLRLIRKEKPCAVYSTGGHINMLVSIVSIFVNVPHLIARSTNIPGERKKYTGLKSKVLSSAGIRTYRNFDYLICQSKEMLDSWAQIPTIEKEKLVIIGNPVLKPVKVAGPNAEQNAVHRLIIVAKLSAVKGHDRLLDIFKELPLNYSLTIAGGDGGTMKQTEKKIDRLKLRSRVEMWGQISDSCNAIIDHDLLVLTSYTEGFPNVVLEALSVGIPVVTFRVGGVSDFIVEGFNGYVVEQGDLGGFKNCIERACCRTWDHQAIADDVQNRFSAKSIAKKYADLIAYNE